jgi:hypothetical protein
METQRDMDQSSYEVYLATESRVKEIVRIAASYLSAQPAVALILLQSQAAFEEYVKVHLELISASTDGTVAPLLRNASSTLLLEQREEVIRAFLADNAPDAIL